MIELDTYMINYVVLRLSKNSVEDASEFLESLEKVFSKYYGIQDVIEAISSEFREIFLHC